LTGARASAGGAEIETIEPLSGLLKPAAAGWPPVMYAVGLPGVEA